MKMLHFEMGIIECVYFNCWDEFTNEFGLKKKAKLKILRMYDWIVYIFVIYLNQ